MEKDKLQTVKGIIEATLIETNGRLDINYLKKVYEKIYNTNEPKILRMAHILISYRLIDDDMIDDVAHDLAMYIKNNYKKVLKTKNRNQIMVFYLLVDLYRYIIETITNKVELPDETLARIAKIIIKTKDMPVADVAGIINQFYENEKAIFNEEVAEVALMIVLNYMKETYDKLPILVEQVKGKYGESVDKFIECFIPKMDI